MNVQFIYRATAFAAIALFALMSGCGGSTAPLTSAAQTGNLDWARALIEENKADVNAKDGYQYTALHHACVNGSAPVAQLLLEKGAQVDALENTNSTPLLLASERNNPDVVAVLISHGADVNVHDRNNWTPLMHSARLGYLEIVKQLVAGGANVNFVDLKTGDSAMSLARSYSQNDVVSFLSGKDHPNTNTLPIGVETVKAPPATKYPGKPQDDTLLPKKINAVPAE